MTSFGAVVRQPAFFGLLAGAAFTLVCLPFVVLDAPLDLFAPGLLGYFFGVWSAIVAILIAAAARLGDGDPAARTRSGGDDRRA